MKAVLRRQTGGGSEIRLAISGLAAFLCTIAAPAQEPIARESALTAPQRAPQFAVTNHKPSPQAEAGQWRAASAGPAAPTNEPRPLTLPPLRTPGILGPPDSRLNDSSTGLESHGSALRLTDSPLGWTPDSDVVRDVPELSLRNDWHCLRSDLWQDLDSLWTRDNVLVLLAAGGASWAIHETLDDDVADNTGRHPHRWGDIQNVIAGIGNPPHHFAAIAGLYAYSLRYQDEEVHELSKSLFNAVALTGGATVLLKVCSGTGTRAPNNEPDSFGGSWPSGHTSSSFAFASVLDEYYGPKVGIPAYILAGLVGWERIDDREHDLSDVVFGAALGYVIGKTVAREHHERFYGVEVQPYLDPVTGTSGVAFERRF